MDYRNWKDRRENLRDERGNVRHKARLSFVFASTFFGLFALFDYLKNVRGNLKKVKAIANNVALHRSADSSPLTEVTGLVVDNTSNKIGTPPKDSNGAWDFKASMNDDYIYVSKYFTVANAKHPKSFGQAARLSEGYHQLYKGLGINTPLSYAEDDGSLTQVIDRRFIPFEDLTREQQKQLYSTPEFAKWIMVQQYIGVSDADISESIGLIIKDDGSYEFMAHVDGLDRFDSSGRRRNGELGLGSASRSFEAEISGQIENIKNRTKFKEIKSQIKAIDHLKEYIKDTENRNEEAKKNLVKEAKELKELQVRLPAIEIERNSLIELKKEVDKGLGKLDRILEIKENPNAAAKQARDKIVDQRYTLATQQQKIIETIKKLEKEAQSKSEKLRDIKIKTPNKSIENWQTEIEQKKAELVIKEAELEQAKKNSKIYKKYSDLVELQKVVDSIKPSTKDRLDLICDIKKNLSNEDIVGFFALDPESAEHLIRRRVEFADALIDAQVKAIYPTNGQAGKAFLNLVAQQARKLYDNGELENLTKGGIARFIPEEMELAFKEFLIEKIKSGTDTEKAFYREILGLGENEISDTISNEQLGKFVNSLVTRGAHAVVGSNDDSLLLNGTHLGDGRAFFKGVKDSAPDIRNYITDDERLIAAYICSRIEGLMMLTPNNLSQETEGKRIIMQYNLSGARTVEDLEASEARTMAYVLKKDETIAQAKDRRIAEDPVAGKIIGMLEGACRDDKEYACYFTDNAVTSSSRGLMHPAIFKRNLEVNHGGTMVTLDIMLWRKDIEMKMLMALRDFNDKAKESKASGSQEKFRINLSGIGLGVWASHSGKGVLSDLFFEAMCSVLEREANNLQYIDSINLVPHGDGWQKDRILELETLRALNPDNGPKITSIPKENIDYSKDVHADIIAGDSAVRGLGNEIIYISEDMVATLPGRTDEVIKAASSTLIPLDSPDFNPYCKKAPVFVVAKAAQISAAEQRQSAPDTGFSRFLRPILRGLANTLHLGSSQEFGMGGISTAAGGE